MKEKINYYTYTFDMKWLNILAIILFLIISIPIYLLEKNQNLIIHLDMIELFLAMFFYYMVTMNLSLAVFNLLPVPPFDGSRIFLLFLPEELYFKLMKYERYIMLAVLALTFLGLLNRPLSAIVNQLWSFLIKETGFVELLWGY